MANTDEQQMMAFRHELEDFVDETGFSDGAKNFAVILIEAIDEGRLQITPRPAEVTEKVSGD